MKSEPKEHRQTLLVVDDEAANLQKLRRTFLGEYRVHQYELFSKIEIRPNRMMAVQAGRNRH